jgi:hypothetical protein
MRVFVALNIVKAKKEALLAANVVSGLMVDALNGDVQKSFQTEKRIAFEAQALTTTVQRFVKQTNQWLTMVNAFDMALKVSRPSKVN